MKLRTLFSTPLYQAALSDHGPSVDPQELEATCISVAEDDEGRARLVRT